MSSKHTGKNDVTQKLFVEAGTGIGREKDGQRRCLGCMELYSEEYEVCPYCGYTIAEEVENALHMFPGTVLYDKYIIGRVIGYGGFGVTYLAWDTVLQIKVAIKEYLPSEFSTRAAGQTQITVFSGDKTKQFNDGMEKFVDEAKRLAKFRSENGIVKIFDSFNENGTAYIAMEYLQGETLAERLEREKTIPVEESIQMLMPIIESLNRVHDEGIIHRDIAPDNIFLTNKGEVKLIDFGASRYATTSRSRSLTVIIKPGFSAEEQYRSRGDQGSHTDVYSVGACLYKMITGQAPPDAMERRALFEKNGKDMLVPIKKFIKDIDPRRENAIYNALNIRIEDRTPDMISLAGELLSEEPVKKRRSGIKKIDPLTWPLWAKIGIPTGLVAAITLCVLFAFGIIGPKSELETRFVVPEGQTLIPNVVAGTLEDAKSKLKAENLNWQIAGKVISTVIDRDFVLRQDPDAFNVVDQGTIIDIIISDGHGMGTVPDVVGLTIELATEKLKEAGYLVKTVEESSDIYASGAVISQEYEAGTMLEKENEIQLVVSTGPEGIDRTKVVKVPSILGMDYDEAKKLLADFKLYPAIDEEVYNSSIPDNQIMGQNPLANTEAHQGDTIYVTVNRGTQTVYVPDVVNKTLEMALSELENAGLSVATKEAQNAEYAPGVVFQQSIKPGTSVTVGTQITVTVSSGFKVKVPDLTGKRSSDAQKTLVDAGLATSITTEPSDSVSKDRVITHDYIGEEVERGTTITLVVSSGRDRTNSSGNGGSGYTDEEEAEVASLVSLKVKNRPNKTEYYVGDSLDTSGLKVIAVYSDDSEKDVTSSCHVLDADLSNPGSVSVKVTFEDNGIEKTASFSVDVNKPKVKVTAVDVPVNKTQELKATVEPEGTNISWSIADKNIAEISNGKVKGIKAGRTQVTATITYAGEEYSSSATVNVYATDILPEKVTLDPTSFTLRIGGKQTIKATPYPANTTVKDYKWTSSNSGIASVNSNGEVQGVGAGKATITVSLGGVKPEKDCTVTVVEAKVEKIEIIKNPTKTTGYYFTDKLDPSGIEVRVTYNDGSTTTIKDTSQLSFKHAAFEKRGNYTVTVTYKGASDTFTVSVSDATISIDPVDPLSVKGNNKVQLKVNVNPAEIKNDVTFESKNKDIATVDSKGIVTAKKAGKAKIHAYVKHGSVNLEASVTVEVLSVEVKTVKKNKNPSKTSYYVGDKLDTSGMKIDLIYTDNSTKTISPDNSTTVKFKVSGSDTLTPKDVSGGKATVVVGYAGTSSTYEFTVTAKTPSIKIDKTSLKLEAGSDGKEISATTVDCGDFYEISWKSSNTSVATVKKTGERKAEVTGASEGSTQVKAVLTYKGYTYESAACDVTVEGAEIKSISINTYPKTTYYIGDDFNDSGMKINVNYTNNTTEVKESGFTCNVDKIKKDTKTVTVSYGGFKTSFDLTVYTPEVTKFKYASQNITTIMGETKKPDVTTKPEKEKGWTFKYTSSNKDIVSVAEDTGVAKGVNPGTATITLTATYKGEYTVQITDVLTVSERTPVSFTVNHEKATETYSLGATVNKSGISVNVTYDNGEIDNGDASGKINVYFKNDEKTTVLSPDAITSKKEAFVYVYYGNIKNPQSFKVKVTPPTVKIDEDKLSLKSGKTATLKTSVANAGTYGYTVTWTSSNPDVATVDSNGKVTAGTKSGTATITSSIKFNDNTNLEYKSSNSCTVTVEADPPKIKLNQSSLTLDYGKEDKSLSASVSNADSGYTLSWETNDSSIVTVSGEKSATIKAVGVGSTQVRAVVTYNGTNYYSDWCTVTVNEAQNSSENEG